VHGFAMNIPWARKSFWTHLMVVLGDVGQVEARFGLFGDSINLIPQHRCTLCAECTTGREVILGTPDRTPR
jgi:hypothetical protein